jgi:dephospho-CoA kinase
MSTPKIVVVGSCASGKSTIVAALIEAGLNASSCAQEHSEIATLWNHSDPDYIVLLDVDLDTIRQRRSPNWPAAIYRAQQRRLETARAAADIVIDTNRGDVASAVTAIQNGIRERFAGLQ